MFRVRRRNENNEIQEYAVTITNQTYIRLALLTIATIVLMLAMRKASHAIVLIFVSFFLALALNAPVYWLSKRIPGKRKGSRTIATTISYLIVVILIGAFIASVVPPLVRQSETLIKQAPHLVNDFRNQNGPVGHLIRKYHLQNEIKSFSSQLSVRLKHVSDTAIPTALHFGNSVFSVLTVLVLTFMMLVEGPRWVALWRDIIPDRHHGTADRLAEDMYRVVKGFVNGQVLLAFIASVLIIPAVLLLHISYPAAIFVVIFICGLIPLIGHTIGAVIVTTVALFDSTTAAIIILAYYILYQQLETYLLQPKIQANSTNMSPLLVFASVIIGVSFGGLFGGLVAIPVAGCLRIALLEYLRSNDIIDDPDFERATTRATK